MNSRPYSKFHVFLIVSLTLLSMLGTSAMTSLVPPDGQVKAANTSQLLQFSAGGHILGFAAGGMYAANGSHALHVDFLNANPVQPQADSAPSTAGKAAPLSRVAYADLWPGVTLAYTATTGSIYDTTYSLAPGANPESVRLRYSAPLTLNADGTLSIAFKTGKMTESAPVAWQEIQGQRKAVDVSFQIHGQEVSFALGSYNPHFALTIDPSLTWSTFLGGSNDDSGYGISVDSSGNIYVTGYSYSTWGNPVRLFTGIYEDAFVAKLNSSGTLIWNTFLGGSDSDDGYEIAVDGSGNVYVTGWSVASWSCLPTPCTVRPYTSSTDPYVGDAFVAKLNTSGVLLWNTFLGGNMDDYGGTVAVDGSGNVYVIGGSFSAWGCSPAFCTVRTYTSGQDTFVAKLNSSGTLIWNTFLGGTMDDWGSGIALDGSGNIFVAGSSMGAWTCLPSSCTARGYTAGQDAFAARLNSSGTLIWNTFLGASDGDGGIGLALDGSGNVYVGGFSNAAWGSPVRAYGSLKDSFIAKLDSSGGLTWNTFLGGSGTDSGYTIALDGSGNVYIEGWSDADWGCTPASCTTRAYTAGQDGYAAKVNPSGTLVWNTFLGGSANDAAEDIAIDGSGNIYVTGYSNATWGSPLTPFIGGSSDAFVVKLPPSVGINVAIGGANQGTYELVQGSSTRQSYAGVNNGPVLVTSTNNTPIIASQRVAYTPDGGTTWPNYSELMGFPVGQLTTVYVMPWYNNVDLNTQIRFGNAGVTATNVTVQVAGVVQGTYPLAPNQSQRISYAGLNNGPVVVSSSGGVPIIASERVAYYDGSAWAGFSELMGFPAGQLSSIYVMPWYNNVDLNTQLRFGNAGTSDTTVTVAVAGVVQGTYPLAPNQSARVSYTGLNNGPVVVSSSGGVPIIASQRVAYYNGSAWTSFTELMGLPVGQLTTSYVLPVYNNANLNTQLRFANVGSASTTVTVKVGGVVQGTYPLIPTQSVRVSYTGLNDGPVVVSSSGGVAIIASERVAYYNGSAWTNFAELMGLPATQLTTSYVMPWYNNADLNTQLRFAVP